MVHHISRELRARNHTVHVHASSGIASARHSVPCNSRCGNHGIAARLRRKLWFAKAIAQNAGRVKGDIEAIRSFFPDVVLARQDAYCWSVVRAASIVGNPCVTYADAPVAYETRLFHGESR